MINFIPYNMKHIVLLCVLLLSFSSCFDSEKHRHLIIPEPLTVKPLDGYFNLNQTIKAYINLYGTEKEILVDHLKNGALKVEITDDKSQANLLLLLNDEFLDEAYNLDITSDAIEIKANSGQGFFYGLQSLFQLINSSTDNALSCITIYDSPRFKYRGFMLDVSRHFASVEFIKKQLDIMAYYKLNTFHWHLTDGAGWRLEVEKYPELTEKAAWRPIKDYRTWSEGGKPFCTKDHPTAYGGYYTKNEVKEIIEYAKERFITIIPEIEMPAHSEEVLAVYPHLSCYGKGGLNAEFCIGNEATFEFLTGVLSEVIELFPSQYIHIGGDEAGKDAWKNCPKCQKRIRENDLKDEFGLQSYLIHRIEEFLNQNGKILLGWDEILEGGLAPNAVVMSWRGEEGGIKAVQAGHEVIMTPGAYCYIDSYQDAPIHQPEAMSGYLPLNKVYQYNPISDAIKKDSSLVLGVQANLWREWISTDEHTEWMMYPRLLALAEVGWTFPHKKNLEDFRKRVIPAVDYLRAKGINAFDIAHEIGDRKESFEEVNHLALNKPVTYKNLYSEHYASTKELALTDGKRGSWSYGDGRWQAVLESDFDVIIDLEEVKTVKSITATFLQEYHAWIWLPKEVYIYVSVDNENFKLLTTLTSDLPIDQTGYHLQDFGWEGETQARYIRYEAKIVDRPGAWLFTDEIIVN